MPATGQPARIPIPASSFPGAQAQESSGRLINAYADPLGEQNPATGPAPMVWRRSPGLSLFSTTALTGYRGGLLVKGTSFEAFLDTAATVATDGTIMPLGTFPGSGLVSMAHNLASTPDVIAVDPAIGAYVLQAQPVTAATVTLNLTGGGGTASVTSLTFTNTSPDVTIPNWPVTVSSSARNNPSLAAVDLVSAINGNAALQAAGVSATFSIPATLIAPDSPALLAAPLIALPGSYTITGLPTGMPVTATLNTLPGAYSIVGRPANLFQGGTQIVISQLGDIGNDTVLAFTPGTSGIVGTFTPATGVLQGGTGIEGIFNGEPTPYNAQGVLPQINSVAFQDSYFFFTSGNNQCYASNSNSLVVNALDFITCQFKSDVTLLRAIAYAGVLLLFTTGSCEIWQDAGNPPPGFPYNRQTVLEHGLLLSGAIAGWETGFSELCWVSQDFGVYWLTPTQQVPIKISPPDLERLIEMEYRAGNDLQAGCYAFAGKKFWHISSPDWSWEYNITSQKWNERWSLNSGMYGRWRGVAGHPAFSKWLIGDFYTGDLLWIDNTKFDENGAVQLFRIESGPVREFPHMVRIARADFDFDVGVGIAAFTQQPTMTVTGAAVGGGAAIWLTVNSTAQTSTGDTVVVSGVTGTTEANGTWTMVLIDATHIQLNGSIFVNAYVSGGTVVDMSAAPTPQQVNPQVAVSCSRDGGTRWGNPLLRNLGQQQKVQRTRVSVKNMGLTGPQGTRWRLDVTDPVYVGLMGGTQSSDPRLVGA